MRVGPPPAAMGGGPCLICGGTSCTSMPEVLHAESYPFLPGGRPVAQGVEGVDYVTTPEAIIDTDRNRIVFTAGSRVPIDDAVKYGLVTKPTRAKVGPEENRAKKAGGSRKAAAKKK